jgi:hypothetical protein
VRIDVCELLPMDPEAAMRALLDRPWRARLGLVDGQGRARMSIGPGRIGGRNLAHDVVVNLGEARQDERGVSIPIAWAATDHTHAFPTFTGELSARPARRGGIELRLHGRYDAPLGALGAAVDEALLHVVAEETLVRLVEHLAEALQETEP